MIITKAHIIKKLESDIEKLNDEIRVCDRIIFLQTEAIRSLEVKVKNQAKEINILLKRMRKNDK